MNVRHAVQHQTPRPTPIRKTVKFSIIFYTSRVNVILDRNLFAVPNLYDSLAWIAITNGETHVLGLQSAAIWV